MVLSYIENHCKNLNKINNSILQFFNFLYKYFNDKEIYFFFNEINIKKKLGTYLITLEK